MLTHGVLKDVMRCFSTKKILELDINPLSSAHLLETRNSLNVKESAERIRRVHLHALHLINKALSKRK